MNLERLTPVPDIGSDDILVVGCVRNEKLRIADFLAHHRNLSVKSFFIIDNYSTDGTTEYLRQQEDVCLYHTSDSYSESRCGVDWLNTVLHKHAVGHWTLILDADELFVFPGFEAVGFPTFLDWVEKSGGQAVCAPMLDMYPRGVLAETGYKAGDSLLAACPWFDKNGYSTQRLNDRLEVIQRGGPRHRVFWSGRDPGYPSPVLQKTPLVKWRADLALTASTHVLTGVNRSDATGLLLHFKFLQDFALSVSEEVQRGEHFMNARQYLAYHDVVAGDPDFRFHFEESVRYEGTRQLLDLGLMTVPAGYPFRPIPMGDFVAREKGGTA